MSTKANYKGNAKSASGGARRQGSALPADGIPILRYGDRNNLVDFRKKCITVCLKLYGNAARFMETGRYYVEKRPRWRDYKPPELEEEDEDDVDDVDTVPEDETERDEPTVEEVVRNRSRSPSPSESRYECVSSTQIMYLR